MRPINTRSAKSRSGHFVADVLSRHLRRHFEGSALQSPCVENISALAWQTRRVLFSLWSHSSISSARASQPTFHGTAHQMLAALNLHCALLDAIQLGFDRERFWCLSC
ncbi:hypothetical protein CBOM_07965 [Ceraceosorus bombacis]|uniref:Uncharacterized protein n=1 Tax=Ceraceosorus bombacis TaxID=401625 RepID=A0A0P1BRI9_9BASI|nr:hypothetical protein CBOM_07965 [Ceraceosorus bombacis]